MTPKLSIQTSIHTVSYPTPSSLVITVDSKKDNGPYHQPHKTPHAPHLVPPAGDAHAHSSQQLAAVYPKPNQPASRRRDCAEATERNRCPRVPYHKQTDNTAPPPPFFPSQYTQSVSRTTNTASPPPLPSTYIHTYIPVRQSHNNPNNPKDQ